VRLAGGAGRGDAPRRRGSRPCTGDDQAAQDHRPTLLRADRRGGGGLRDGPGAYRPNDDRPGHGNHRQPHRPSGADRGRAGSGPRVCHDGRDVGGERAHHQRPPRRLQAPHDARRASARHGQRPLRGAWAFPRREHRRNALRAHGGRHRKRGGGRHRRTDLRSPTHARARAGGDRDPRTPVVIVDFQAHVFPPAYLDALCRLDSSVSLEEPDPASGMTYLFDRTLGRRINTVTFAGQDPEIRIAHMDELGVDVQVVSVPPPGADRFAPDAAMELARAANDAIGRWCHDYPGRFVGLCTLPTSSVPLALDELERCVEALEMRGFGCYSNLNGRPLDDEALLPLYERIARYGVPVYIHPTAPLATEATDLDIHPTLIFGWAFDATVAMTRLVYGRVTCRLPEIPFIVADVCGVLAFFAQRAVNIYTGRTEEIRQRYG